MDHHRSLQQAQALLLDAIVNASVEELDLPHIVVCHDPANDQSTYSGPYPDLPSALIGAEAEDAELNADLPAHEPRWVFTTRPLYPPHPTTETTSETATAA